MTMKAKRDALFPRRKSSAGGRAPGAGGGSIRTCNTVREWWKKQKADGFLQRWRRWYHDEPRREPSQ
jgi:hypothetical protein